MAQATLRGRNRRLGGALIGLVLLCALLFVAPRVGEAQTAEGDGCAPVCIVLIQVDGLEPKDVTEASTPYLWRLAHPRVQDEAAPVGALAGRAGWIWQAPRGVVSSGTGSATASLLTGAYPEKTGIPADDFYGPTADNRTDMVHQRLTAGGFGDTTDPEAGTDAAEEPISAPQVDTALAAAREEGTDVAAFLGDPGLARVTSATSDASPYWFPPGNDANSARFPEGQFTGDPRLCPIPRYPDGGAQIPGQTPSEDNYNPSHCPASDMTTANKAMSDLRQTTSASVGFTFMHLAEVGAAKRLAADGDTDSVSLEETPGPPSVPEALSNMDQAIMTFAEQYAQLNQAKWDKTVLMVVGAHGYQTTPLIRRIPHPEDASNPLRDLADYVEEFNAGGSAGTLRLVPQGTMATVYYGFGEADPAQRRTAIEDLRTDLLTEVNGACRERDPSFTGDCLKGVYYVDERGREPSETLTGNFKTWQLDARNPDRLDERTGASGDLVLVPERGWAFGRAAGPPRTVNDSGEAPLSNPNSASAGGPQERAVAALVNGPAAATNSGAVRNLDGLSSADAGAPPLKYYPVSNGKVDVSDPNVPPPTDNPKCPDTTTDPGGLACANRPEDVVDDARDEGHEAQPIAVDFATTISALLLLPMEHVQGRVLQEAFVNKLALPRPEEEPPVPPQCSEALALTQAGTPVDVTMNCSDQTNAPMSYGIVTGPEHGTLGAVSGDTVTYTPAPGFSGVDSFTYQASSSNGTSEPATAFITVFEPPVVQREEGFKFRGLVQNLKARVVDSKDKTYAHARRGSVLSTIRLEGDFGKEEGAVTLTFYRRAAGASRRTRRGRGRAVRLKAIARFDPFVVKRGHVKMRLKVPALFKPQYVGLTVREIARTASGARVKRGGQACTTLKTRKPVPFRCVGPARGVIVRIADAHRLHKRKVGGRSSPRRRR